MKYLINKPVFRAFGTVLLGLFAMTSNNVQAAPAAKVQICHYPPGNLDNPQTISINDNAWLKHLALHGDRTKVLDTKGPCSAEVLGHEPEDENVSLCESHSGGGLVFTIDNPLVQESTADGDGLITYDFESVANWDSVFRADTGVTTISWDGVGTYEGSGAKVDTPNKYGAVDGVGKYLFIRDTEGRSVEDNPGVTLTFDEPVAYFGFWWSAGDHANRLQVTLVDGTVMGVETGLVWGSEGFVQSLASVGGHMGNPTGPFLDQNNHEPYAYLNLTSKDECSKIAKVRFHGRNFETDNHTVTTTLIDPPGTLIPLAPQFGSAGRFNLREVNEIKVNAGNGGGGAVSP